MKLIRARLTYKLQDMWIGVYWGYFYEVDPSNEDYEVVSRLEMWVCLLPCFPIHLVWRLK